MNPSPGNKSMKRISASLLGALLAAALLFVTACGHKAPPKPSDGKPPPRGAPGYSDKRPGGY